VKRDCVPDDLTTVRLDTLILQECVGGIGTDDLEALSASKLSRESQIMQHGCDKEELLIVAQVLSAADQGAKDKGPDHMRPNDRRGDPEGQVRRFLCQGAVGDPDASNLAGQGDSFRHSDTLRHVSLL